MCNKIFNSNFIKENEIKCLEGVPGEDTYFSMSAFLKSKNVYYIPSVGNIYYTRIGVSVSMDSSKLKDREGLYEYAMATLIDSGYVPTKKDLAYIQFKFNKIYF